MMDDWTVYLIFQVQKVQFSTVNLSGTSFVQSIVTHTPPNPGVALIHLPRRVVVEAVSEKLRPAADLTFIGLQVLPPFPLSFVPLWRLASASRR